MRYSQLSREYSLNLRTIARRVTSCLAKDPPTIEIPQPPTDEAYLQIDGLWFGKKLILLFYKQVKYAPVLLTSFSYREWGHHIAKDLKYLKEDQQYRFTCFISDGGTGILKGLLDIYPNRPHQLCMAHVHRSLGRLLGKKSKDERILELKKLADHIWLIESQEALHWWKQKVIVWRKEHWKYLFERREDIEGRWWYVHRKARRAVDIMLMASQECFTFIRHPLMPKTNNELEGLFVFIRRRVRTHPGMKRERLKHFLKWLVYFYNQEKLS